MTQTDRISLWFTRHYMLLFNAFVAVYLGLSFAAPALNAAGLHLPASVLYRAYGLTCHQLAYRSWFLEGDQAYYPLKAAGIPGVLSYDEVIAPNRVNIWAAKQWEGDAVHGFKVALCERDVAIYGSMLLFGLIFALTGRKFPVISWQVWIFIGILPIALDGVSQILSQIPIDFIHAMLPYRESTPLLRTLTGTLFGGLTAWFAYPLVEMSMQDTRKMLADKYSKMGQKPEPEKVKLPYDPAA